jgi:hypothetical protein
VAGAKRSVPRNWQATATVARFFAPAIPTRRVGTLFSIRSEEFGAYVPRQQIEGAASCSSSTISFYD